MADNDSFMAAVLENPEDDAPRLAFADWLQERGEGEYANFIRTQCAMPERLGQRPPPDVLQSSSLAMETFVRRWQLWFGPFLRSAGCDPSKYKLWIPIDPSVTGRELENALFDRVMGLKWNRWPFEVEAPDGVIRSFAVDRGFVSRCKVVRGGDPTEPLVGRALLQQPITELHIANLAAGPWEPMSGAWLWRARRLELDCSPPFAARFGDPIDRGTGVRTDDLAPVFNDPHFCNVRSVRLDPWGEQARETVVRFLASPMARVATEVELRLPSETALALSGVTTDLPWKSIALEVFEPTSGSGWAEAAACLGRLPGVERLGCNFSRARFESLFAGRPAAQTPDDDEFLLAMRRADGWSRLVELNVRQAAIGPEGLRALAKAPFVRRLRRLELHSTLDSAGHAWTTAILELAGALDTKVIEMVDLHTFPLDQRVVEYLTGRFGDRVCV